MKWVQGAYTQRYNSRHKLFGHLFQGRYKAVPVDGGRARIFGNGQHLYSFESGETGLIQIGKETVETIPLEQLSVVFKSAGRGHFWLYRQRVMGHCAEGKTVREIRRIWRGGRWSLD